MILNLDEQEIEIFGSEPLVGPRIIASYRRANNSEDIEKINDIGNWLCTEFINRLIAYKSPKP